ncbi:ABC transporter substrate-binding protein, partial [Lutispora sp.]|uniref:ABC transporter substrate-binding protein n=1 Tax=Lutispora sp. TaxID=2828727 RepID=UPI002B206AB5
LKLIKTGNNEERIEDKQEIVVHSYDPFTNYKNQQMINIVRKFEKEHSGVTVRLITSNDIQQLNTELLAGKGPDVLCGYYPAREYIDKGILTDLLKIIDADKGFSIKDYDTVVIESSKHNNALNIIPISYSLRCYIGNKKLLADKRIDVNLNWTWKDFYKAVTTDKRCYAIPQFEHDENYGLEDLIKDDADYYIDWKKKIARFDPKEFLAALKLLKSIKIKFMHPEADASRRDADNLSKLEEAVLFYPMYIGRYLDLNFFSRYSNGKIVLPSPKGEYSDAKTFKSFNASINDGSKNKEEAWKFVKYLLSEEIQFYISENDFVINKKADERRISEYLAKMKETNRLEESNAYVENLNIIRSNLNNNSSFVPQDELFNTIWEEIKVYLSGSRSAEETAKTIQNKVELYLNE